MQIYCILATITIPAKAMFDRQPTLSNEMLTLRPLREEDFDDLYAVASDPLIWEQHPAKERSEPEGFATFFREALASKGALVAIDRRTSRIIGTSRYMPVKETGDAIEIGWTFLARSHWGGVYNRAMKELMIEHAFRFVPHVLLYIHPDNRRSQQAALKIGGVKITELNGQTLSTRPSASVIYHILRPSP
ncbi:MAG TPA: GNAT family N-acetyltransferase [Puia sp.]|nr:GNAT family N-acetyltransferase [Puia sp.]